MSLLLGLVGLVAPAQATPFNAFGYRMDPGTVALNPYLGADLQGAPFAGQPWGSLYAFAGLTRWLDVGGGINTAWVDGALVVESWEAIPRWFPSPDLELALAAHLISEPGGVTTLGPEVHLAGYPTEAIGVWANVGARYELGAPATPQMFAWLAAELTGDVPFFAFEVDLEGVDGGVEATLIPSVGVWLGAQQETGVSVGWLLPLDRSEVGVGMWLWRSVDLRGQGRRRRNRPRKRVTSPG